MSLAIAVWAFLLAKGEGSQTVMGYKCSCCWYEPSLGSNYRFPFLLLELADIFGHCLWLVLVFRQTFPPPPAAPTLVGSSASLLSTAAAAPSTIYSSSCSSCSCAYSSFHYYCCCSCLLHVLLLACFRLLLTQEARHDNFCFAYSFRRFNEPAPPLFAG